MNFDRLRFVAERAEVGEAARGDLRGDHPRAARQLPRVLRAARQALGDRIQLSLCRREVAHLFVGVEVANRRETDHLLAEFRRRRIEAFDLSDNEMAKLHVRHLVGGHAPAATNEILYRFEFPERPGALMQFLNSMSAGWNISLFHYRNHGADYGRVLVGMQVPPSDKADFRAFLDRLGYDCVDETGQSCLSDVPRRLTRGRACADTRPRGRTVSAKFAAVLHFERIRRREPIPASFML